MPLLDFKHSKQAIRAGYLTPFEVSAFIKINVLPEPLTGLLINLRYGKG